MTGRDPYCHCGTLPHLPGVVGCIFEPPPTAPERPSPWLDPAGWAAALGPYELASHIRTFAGAGFGYPPAQRAALLAEAATRLRVQARTIQLLGRYGEAKFGDEWWPGNARVYLGEEGRELEHLLDGGSAQLADEHEEGQPGG